MMLLAYIKEESNNVLGRRYHRILCLLSITEMSRSVGSLSKTKVVRYMVSSKNQKPGSPGIPKMYLGLV